MPSALPSAMKTACPGFSAGMDRRTQCRTKDVAAAAEEGGPLMAIETNDPRITLVAGGYPLFVDGVCAGGIGVGGGSEAEDCAIAEHVLSVFEQLVG